MTTRQKKRILYILGILFTISFFLPAVYSMHDMLFGIHCAVYVVMGLIIDLDSQDFQTILFDIFLILPNLLMILAFLFHKKFPPLLKYFFLLIVFLSAGSWSINFGANVSFTSDLYIGYWLWFLSSTSFMLIAAIPAKKQPKILD
ncbi:MAG: hypothetical protein ACJASQ_000094 [Crocinitomicaceae bacterium]|jgi:hypothetical protein